MLLKYIVMRIAWHQIIKNWDKQMEPHPEWQSLAKKMIQLYKEITYKALENEKKKAEPLIKWPEIYFVSRF